MSQIDEKADTARKVETIDLFIPAEDRIVEILQYGLMPHFAEVTVEWVYCPDLTQAPFCLAASGLCGNEALIEIGSTSNLFPFPKKEKIYNILEILEVTGRKGCNTFIIGAGVCPRIETGKLGEFIMNWFYPHDISLPIWNENLLAFPDENTGKCILDRYTEAAPKCSMQGNFFISDGYPGTVLKIEAKRRMGKVGFIQAIQNSLCEAYTLGNMAYPYATIGLGGIILVNNARVFHHVMPSYWPNPLQDARAIHDSLLYYSIESPVVAVGTLLNTKTHYDPMSAATSAIKTSEVQVTSSHFHGYSPSGGGGHFHTDESPSTVEYLGYFRPAPVLYYYDRSDPCPYLLDFSDITSCW